MPKKKTTPKEVKKNARKTTAEHFVDELVEMPEGIAHLVNAGTEFEGKLRLVFNRATIELARTFTGELIFARQLPVDTQSIQLTNDAIAIYINQTDESLEANEVIRKARAYYDKHHSNANEDAMTLALTDANAIDLVPEEYNEDELEGSILRKSTVSGGEVPAWRSEQNLHLPPPKRPLTNMYEGRLKTVRDLLIKAEEEDPYFGVTFYNTVNGAVSKALRLIGGGGEETDPDGFPSIVPNS